MWKRDGGEGGEGGQNCGHKIFAWQAELTLALRTDTARRRRPPSGSKGPALDKTYNCSKIVGDRLMGAVVVNEVYVPDIALGKKCE